MGSPPSPLQTTAGAVSEDIWQSKIPVGHSDLFAGMVGKPVAFEYEGKRYQVFTANRGNAASVKVATVGTDPKLVVVLDDAQLAGKPQLKTIRSAIEALDKQVRTDLASKKLGLAKTHSDAAQAQLNSLAVLLKEQGCAALNAGCFVAGTLLRTPSGLKAIESFAPGDEILSQDEYDPRSGIITRRVEAVFRRYAPVLGIHLYRAGDGGPLVVRSTGEHPFYV